MSPARRPAWKALLVLVALTSVLKLCLVLAPSKAVLPLWVVAEEQHCGNVATEMLDGPLLSFFDYTFVPNAGGSLVAGVLTIPCVALFGSSLAAIRVVPIVFNALVVCLVFAILDRFASRRAAWFGGVLMACAPPGYSILAITACATHVEANALTLAAVYLYLRLHEIAARDDASGAPVGETRLAVALGCVAGFGLYFAYSVLPALAALCLFELLHDKLFVFRRWFRCALLGFAIGFAPWLLYNAYHGFRGLEVYDVPLWQRFLGHSQGNDSLGRLELFFTDYFPSSFFFRPTHALEFIAASAAILLFAIAVWTLRAELRAGLRALVSIRFRPTDLGATTCFVFQPPILVACFALVDVGQGSIKGGLAHDGRYVAPMLPFLALIAGCVLDRSASFVRIGPRVPMFATAGAAFLCVLATLDVCDRSRIGDGLVIPGASASEFAHWTAWTWRTDITRLERIVEGCEHRRAPEVADEMIFALAQGLKWGFSRIDPHDPEKREIARRHIAALEFLHRRVADAYKPYCEPRARGERIWSYRERDQFWANYRFRQRAALARAQLKLDTPGG